MAETLAFGPHPAQVADLHRPVGDGPHPAVVLWHGGDFDAALGGRDGLAAAAQDLAAHGFLAVNATYRRIGAGGGWPATFDDARAAYALLDELPVSDDVSVLGFSAGAPLAVHAAKHAPASRRPSRLVNIAGVTALERVARIGGAGSGTWRLLGDPATAPEAYAGADPWRAVPLGVASLTVHGDADRHVPPALSEAWTARARAKGDDARLELVPGASHFDLHHPGSLGWGRILAWLTG